MSGFTEMKEIARGAFGTIKLGYSSSNYLVALKCISPSRCSSYDTRSVSDTTTEVIPIEIFREIQSLRLLNDIEGEGRENIVKLLDVHASLNGEVVLVFPYSPIDLQKLISTAADGVSDNDNATRIRPFLPRKIILHLFHQSLLSLHHLHASSASLLHRDIKPSNFLLSPSTGLLQLCDFGLCTRRLTSDERDAGRRLTHAVCTRWYRPPEILFGGVDYDVGIDLWGLGCVLGEMLNSSPLFPGGSDIEQIFRVLVWTGAPNSKANGMKWRDAVKCGDWGKIVVPEDWVGRGVEELVPRCSTKVWEGARRALKGLLELDPKERSTTRELLEMGAWGGSGREAVREFLIGLLGGVGGAGEADKGNNGSGRKKTTDIEEMGQKEIQRRKAVDNNYAFGEAKINWK